MPRSYAIRKHPGAIYKKPYKTKAKFVGPMTKRKWQRGKAALAQRLWRAERELKRLAQNPFGQPYKYSKKRW